MAKQKKAASPVGSDQPIVNSEIENGQGENAMAQQTEVAGLVGSDQPIANSELGKEPVVGLAGEKVKPKDLDMEAFMAETVTIRIEPTAVEGENAVVVLSVNGVNQPVLRGKPTTVKRKYLECLARTRTTVIRQERPNPNDPTVIINVPTTTPTYPFVVLEDKNKRGAAWLEGILRQG